MQSAEIRRKFLDYFADQGHTPVPSSALVPADDPTLLFTNSGMVQFKDVFLGRESRPYVRACSSQRCLRAGGKHNDLENVGYTARHHTFFEMLGNFSFGDYFKEDAVGFAWAFLTEVIGLPPEKLWVTIYHDDDEAHRAWTQGVGVDPERVLRIGDKPGGGSDNFWQMGDTGPCGPCTEIFFDHGPEVPGGLPGTPDEDGDRYIEIWNLVFMQFERDAEGRLHPLPRPSVDTGMGLERLAAVLQRVHSNYEIDLFRKLIAAARAEIGCAEHDGPSLRVIADHLRSVSFLIVDGVMPSNEGRGYVLRRILRRAARHGHKLGRDTPFLHRLVPALVAEMGEAYPELERQQAVIEQAVRAEEERFAETLATGMTLLDRALTQDTGGTIRGETVFQLYDTYGFPVDLTADIARERGLAIDLEGFDREMDKQRSRARAASHFAQDQALDVTGDTCFVGYECLESDARVVGLFVDQSPAQHVSVGTQAVVVLDITPFYAESGGQVGDVGELRWAGGRFRVDDTRKQGAVHLHFGVVESGILEPETKVAAVVTGPRRDAIRRHHSATHLLHKSLRDVLGNHVTQKGSLVTADRLRFDFSHQEPLSPEQRAEVERRVRAEILANVATDAVEMSMDEALTSGAMALFGEKYGDRVRVLTIGSSVELCGGTHVTRTGDIGAFCIVSESGVASGVRRIEAVAGEVATRWIDERLALLDSLAERMKTGAEELPERIDQLIDRARAAEREIERIRALEAAREGRAAAERAVWIGDVAVLATRADGLDAKALREMADGLRDRLGRAAIVIGSTQADGRVQLVATVSKVESKIVPAGPLVAHVAGLVGGKGGGRPDFAMAGGNQPEALDAALATVEGYVRERLASSAPGSASQTGSTERRI